MKKILILLLLGYLNSNIGFCQLLSEPSLTVEDFEIALKDPDHLRNILHDHNFEFYTTGATNFRSGYAISNPLTPDLKTLRSEYWELKNPKDRVIFKIDMYEWESNHAPQPDIIKTIRVMINGNSIYAPQMSAFLERIRNKYPNSHKRYFRNNELYHKYGQPIIVFTNNSQIEVRTESVNTSYGSFYTVSFDLVKINL